MIITAHQGETLDALVWRFFRRASPLVEQILSANRGLAALGNVLPEGTAVDVPDELLRAAPAPTLALVNLWD